MWICEGQQHIFMGYLRRRNQLPHNSQCRIITSLLLSSKRIFYQSHSNFFSFHDMRSVGAPVCISFRRELHRVRHIYHGLVDKWKKKKKEEVGGKNFFFRHFFLFELAGLLFFCEKPLWSSLACCIFLLLLSGTYNQLKLTYRVATLASKKIRGWLDRQVSEKNTLEWPYFFILRFCFKIKMLSFGGVKKYSLGHPTIWWLIFG